MIHRTAAPCQTVEWQRLQAEAICRLDDLLAYLDLDPASVPFSPRAHAGFKLRVPRPYLELIEKGNPRDPLLLQILPVTAEEADVAGFSVDPVGDLAKESAPGVIRKYTGRTLLVTTGACSVHCRYCFRRHFPYDHSVGGEGRRHAALAHIEAHPEINEVILSGGDPLALPDERVLTLWEALEKIPHVERLRIHTRTPVVIPQRMTRRLVDILAGSRLQPVVVLHVNHPREVSARLAAALPPLVKQGITLLNQSVLLRGVNDSLETLSALSDTLFATGVLPYYLHLLDPVRGAAHFEVSESTARELHRQLRERLPGYLVPRLVREKAGAASKIPVF